MYIGEFQNHPENQFKMAPISYANFSIPTFPKHIGMHMKLGGSWEVFESELDIYN